MSDTDLGMQERAATNRAPRHADTADIDKMAEVHGRVGYEVDHEDREDHEDRDARE